MKKGLAALLMMAMLCCAAAAVGDSGLIALLQQYSASAVLEATEALPEDVGLTLTERETEIYRLVFARGYDAAAGSTPVASSASDDGTLVWIPTNGGRKYHDKASCSGMIDPVQVTVGEAQRLGYEPCGRCYKQ